MKRTVLLGFLVSATAACAGPHEGPTNTAVLADCGAGQTVLFSKVAPPSAGVDGASGIADAPAVLGSSASSEGSFTAYASTATSCVPAVCGAGQVAVAKPGVSTGGTSEPTSGVGLATPGFLTPGGGTETGGVATDPVAVDPGVDVPSTGETETTPTTGAATPTTGASSTVTASDVTCTSPPPACGSGESPSYAPAGFWHCMPLCDANNTDLVVISYGGVYGNGGVCAGPPPQSACPTSGQVWTWNYLQEAWECEAECDNGQYDQHTFGNQTVCVPC